MPSLVHKNRDKVLLEDTTGSTKLRRALGETSDDEFLSEEEVFRPTYTGPDEDDELAGEEEDEEGAEPLPRKERKRVLKERATKGVELPAKGRFAKPDPTSSDEDDDEDEDAASAAGGSDDESEEEEENWGSNPSAYYARPSARRGRDEVDSDSDDEELAERRMLEEKEVRLQQRKAREGMAKGDWGLDDLAEGEDIEEAKEEEERYTVFLRRSRSSSSSEVDLSPAFRSQFSRVLVLLPRPLHPRRPTRPPCLLTFGGTRPRRSHSRANGRR